MRLADDDILVNVGGEQFALRASLRAALRLSLKYGDFGVVLRSIQHKELGVLATIVAETSTTRTTVPELLECLSGHALQQVLAQLIPACVEVVTRFLDLGDNGDDQKPKRTRQGEKRVTHAEFYEALFEIGAGRLGWSPTDTWAATPQEILSASKGHSAFFGATPEGSNDDSKSSTLAEVASLGRVYG